MNGQKCQENIKTDARNHAQINGNTMLDLCLTNHVKIVGKGSKSKPKGSQQMTKSMQLCIEKTRQKEMSNKYRKIFQKTADPAPKSSLNLLISRYARGVRANGSPGLFQSGFRDKYTYIEDIYKYICKRWK